jgi:YHS domain-containing protein
MMTARILSLFAVAVAWIPLAAQAAEPALGGNCPVCLVETGKVIPGLSDHAVTFDRQGYYFPSVKEKEMFRANPVKYAPALGGDCVVCRVHGGLRVPGKVGLAVVHKQRAYLFASEQERDQFKADPERYESVDVGLGGYCPVCVVTARKWVPGRPEFVSVYDGVRYFFPSAEEQKRFDADPARYVPALEGDCVVCLKDGGKHVAGSLGFSAMHQGRLYLFADEAAQQRFLADPTKYANVDLANDGRCIVCARMGKKDVPGKAEFASIYRGRRYLFASPKERAMFDADPQAFVGASPPLGAQPAARPAHVSIVGKTACATCSFGVHPLEDPQSLGIAVVAGNIKYIVEGGEKRYPAIFDARFDGLKVRLTGTVKRAEGDVVWVEPDSLVRIP